MTETMLQKLEGVNVGFLRQVAGMTDQKLGVNTWKKEVAERLLHETGKKLLREYIKRSQGTVADWVVLRPILEVCAEETGLEGRGRARE